MRVLSVLPAVLLAIPTAALADDFKVIKLEQDVRNLERQVGDLARQVGELEHRKAPLEVPPASSVRTVPATNNELWLDSANWNRVRVGMNELDVIRILGKPASMRAESAESRTLLYAMELGSSGFLGGNVQLKDRRVVAVNPPVLR